MYFLNHLAHKFVDVKKIWRSRGPKTACDTDAGEVYMQDSPGTVGSLEQCKMFCEHVTECRSITYYDSGWCSHYSTPCTSTTMSRKAKAFQLITDFGKARDRLVALPGVGASDDTGVAREAASNIGVIESGAKDSSAVGISAIAMVTGCSVAILVVMTAVVVAVLWCRVKHIEPNSTERAASDYDVENWQQDGSNLQEESETE